MKSSSRCLKKSGFFVDQKKRGNETSNGVVCRNQQVLMHEVGRRQQVYEDARKMHRTKILEKMMENWESVTLEVMIW